VQQLQREMRKDNKRLNLNDEFDSSPSTPVEEEFEKLDLESDEAEITEKASISEETNEPKHNGHNVLEGAEPAQDQVTKSSLDASDVDDEYGSREEVESRLLGSLHANDLDVTSAAVSDDDGVPQPKLGKAKAKRAKKAARQEVEVQAEQENKCAACNKSFPSKTKLFAHIKELDHVSPVPKAGKGRNKKR
jgi:DnaJ family protein A protein 5